MYWMSIFRWVGWNSLLAIIPVALAYLIAWLTRRPGKHAGARNLLLAFLGLCWLAFLPNTCYLLSEWRHFLPSGHFFDLYFSWKEEGNKEAIIRLMLITLFFYCYSTFGMLTFALAIRPLVRVVRSKGLPAWLFGIPLFLLVSLGMYLGLMKRLNSWNLLNRPALVWSKVAVLTHNAWDVWFITAFAAFLWLAFLVTDIWIDGFLLRVKKH